MIERGRIKELTTPGLGDSLFSIRMKNEILFRRKNKVIVEKGNHILSELYVATALKNLESLGFTFSLKLLEAVRTMSKEDFLLWYKKITALIKKSVGAHVHHEPMYPNFPNQVMEMDRAELYMNAIRHYLDFVVRDLTGLHTPNRGLPDSEKEERFPLLQRTDLKIIGHGTEEELRESLKMVFASATSISETDREDLAWAISYFDADTLYTSVLPETIPMKETLSFTVARLHAENKIDEERISSYFKTATDVLRFAVALSEGDTSLSIPTRFRSFKRAERRLLLSILERVGNRTEDMLRYPSMWKRLGERLHPGEHKHKYPKTFESFDVIRNDLDFETFNSKVERAFLDRNIQSALTLLKQRPGEFGRRLDHLLRNASETELIVKGFREVASEIATPVLLQVMAHFKDRPKKHDHRVFFPKGQVAHAHLIENKLPSLDVELCLSVVEICQNTLILRFTELPPLGKVMIDKSLKTQLVPFSQRTASRSLRTLTRGSTFTIPKGDTIRFFTYWCEGKVEGRHSGRLDIDLSSTIYTDKWALIDHISFTNLYSKNLNSVHSGDITSAPNGASEFIDLHIPTLLKKGVRYVVMSLLSYSEQSFVEMPECFAGWMMRDEPGSGEIYEPSTVVDKIDLSGDKNTSIPVILDIVERKMIWCDLSLSHEPDYDTNTVESHAKGIVAIGTAMTNLVKASLFDLFTLHAQARGVIVESREEAEIIFSLHEGITPFDSEIIMSEYLA